MLSITRANSCLVHIQCLTVLGVLLRRVLVEPQTHQTTEPARLNQDAKHRAGMTAKRPKYTALEYIVAETTSELGRTVLCAKALREESPADPVAAGRGAGSAAQAPLRVSCICASTYPCGISADPLRLATDQGAYSTFCYRATGPRRTKGARDGGHCRIPGNRFHPRWHRGRRLKTRT